MDPNETLAKIRMYASEYRRAVEEGETEVAADWAGKLAAYIFALDQWLSKGGFLPTAWQPGVGQIDPDYVLDRIVEPLGPPDPAGAELPDTYVTGDGERHASYDAAVIHADRVARTMGQIIAIEEV